MLCGDKRSLQAEQQAQWLEAERTRARQAQLQAELALGDAARSRMNVSSGKW